MGMGTETPLIDDAALLHKYVHERSDAAFETLMQRHAKLVYSAALRQTADTHLAEDVTQAVFIVLSRKAATLSSNAVLSAWLLTTTRLTVVNLRRQRDLRLRIEHETATMADTTSAPLLAACGFVAPGIAPPLDEAIAGLNDADRTAVVLRFFEHCSLGDVGKRLGISPGAAEKRVARAVEKLRRMFARRGVTLSALVLASLLTEHTLHAMPAALAASLPAAVASAKAGVQLSPALAYANTAIKVITMTHMKQLAVCAILFLSLGLAGGSLLTRLAAPAPSVMDAAQADAAPHPEAAARH